MSDVLNGLFIFDFFGVVGLPVYPQWSCFFSTCMFEFTAFMHLVGATHFSIF